MRKVSASILVAAGLVCGAGAASADSVQVIECIPVTSLPVSTVNGVPVTPNYYAAPGPVVYTRNPAPVVYTAPVYYSYQGLPEGARVVIDPSQARLGPEEVLVRYDTDRDGYLDDESWVIRTRAQIAAEGSDVIIFDDHALEAVDANGDGRISPNEWVVENGGYYGSLDLNNNGIIDSEE